MGASVAVLERHSADLQDAISRTGGDWDDSRREATAHRYLRPHAGAQELLREQLSFLLPTLDDVRTAADNTDLSVDAAGDEADHCEGAMGRARAGTAEGEAVTRSLIAAEGEAAQIHAETIRLANEANGIIP